MAFSFFWLVVSTYELYSVKLCLGLKTLAFSTNKIGINDLFFANSFYHDSFSQSARLFILFISLIFMIFYRFEFQNDSRLRRIEFLFLFLVGCSLSMLMVSASSLLSLFLSVEGLVMVMYVLTAGSSVSSGFPIVKILRFRAVEGALKYAITNAIATGFFLLGSILVFFFTGGDIYFISIFKTLGTLGSSLPLDSTTNFFVYYGLLLGVILIALTFLFKLGAVPFHN
jgi:NADH-quinone oxidoreductase subunit N